MACSPSFLQAACCWPPPGSNLPGWEGSIGWAESTFSRGKGLRSKNNPIQTLTPYVEEELLGPTLKLTGPFHSLPPSPSIWNVLHGQECPKEQRGWPSHTPYGDHHWPQGSWAGALVSKVTACAAEGHAGTAWRVVAAGNEPGWSAAPTTPRVGPCLDRDWGSEERHFPAQGPRWQGLVHEARIL